MKMPGHILSRAQAREYLGVSEFTFCIWVQAGKILCIPMGNSGKVKGFTKKCLDQFMDSEPQAWFSGEAK
jgi:predicted site-specific integrase-resolvase